MSPDLLDILAVMDLKELDTQMALQCAPLFMGIKISNMLIVDLDNNERVRDTFRGTAVSFHILSASANKTYFLVYDKEKLQHYLYKEENQKLLGSLGYRAYDLASILMELTERYQDYMQRLKPFPHELGLLLGYPIEDVMGFIDNHGQKPLYTGYWKVYDNLSEKLLLFDQYQNAKERLIRLVAQGMSIKYILRSSKMHYHTNQSSLGSN